MKPINVLCSGLLAAVAGLAAHPAIAQLDLSALGTNYVETFNGIASGLPPGWSVRTGATVTNLGAEAPFTMATVNWASSSGQFANYPSTRSNAGTNFTGLESTTIQNNCTNRAPGIRQGSTFGDPGAAFVLCLSNTLKLASFEISLDFLMLSVQGRSTAWTLEYAIGNDPTNFTAKAGYDDPGVFGAMHTNASFGHVLDNQSEKVWIRVFASKASTGSGSRDTFGIDNFALSWVTNATPVTNPPSITTPPHSRTNSADTAAGFSVVADGSSPLSYQWRRNNADLADTNNISGANSATLNLAPVFKADEADFRVVITNSAGSVTSSVARLTVIDPVVVTPPANRTNVAGDTAGFSATAAGTAPVGYQWFHNTTKIPGAVTDSYAVTNVAAADQGDYSVIVSNAFGTAVSPVATLTVFPTPARRIARWDFNSTNNCTPAAPLPCEGTGTASHVGNLTATFSSGSPCDPAPSNISWNTTHYPAQGTSNLQAGVEFRASTVGFQNLLVTWEQRNSSTASKYARLQYTTDGLNFSNHNVVIMGATNSSFVFYADDLSAIPGVNDNPDFAFRIVTEIESSATGGGSGNYVATGPSSAYSTAGTIRLDLVNVYADPAGSVAAEPPRPLNIQLIGSDAVLTWTNPASALQRGPAVNGIFTNVPGASSPYTNPASEARQFFRLDQ